MKETLAQTFVVIKYQQKVLMYLSIGNFDQFSFRIVKNYYPQVFLEEWQKKEKKIYLQKTRKKEKEKKMPQYITDDIEISVDESD